MDQPGQTAESAPEGGIVPQTAAELSGRVDAALADADDLVVAAARMPGDVDREQVRQLIGLKRDPVLLRLANAAPSEPVVTEAEEALDRLEAALAELSAILPASGADGDGGAVDGPQPAQLDRFAAWFDGDTETAFAGAAASAQKKRDAAAAATADEDRAAREEGTSEPPREGATSPKPAAERRRGRSGRGRRRDTRAAGRRRGPVRRLLRLCGVALVLLAIVILRDGDRRQQFSDALQLPRVTSFGSVDDLIDWAGAAEWAGSAAMAVGWMADDVWSVASGAVRLAQSVAGPQPEAPPTAAVSEAPELRTTAPRPEPPPADHVPETPVPEVSRAEETVAIDREGDRRAREARLSERVLAANSETARLRREVARLTALVADLRAGSDVRPASEDDVRAELERERALRALIEARLAEVLTRAEDGADPRKVALLNEQVKHLRTQLAALQGLLDDAMARDAANQVRLEALGAELNAALARLAAEERARQEAEARDLRRDADAAGRNEAPADRSDGAPARGSTEETFSATHQIGDRAANAREGPGTTFPRIATLRPGTPLELKATDNGWGRFTISDSAGARRDVWIFLRLTRDVR